MSNIPAPGLETAWIEPFIDKGFLRLDGAFSRALAREGREALWSAIGSAMGLSPHAPAGWTQPVVRLGFQSGRPFVEAANTPRLHAAYDALAGEGRWIAPAGLGTFPIRFPSPDDPGDAGWHVDASFGTGNPDFMQWRVNVRSRGRALLMLFLFSDVGPDDAPTRLRIGSHAAIARRLLPHGEEGMTLAELAADDFAQTAALPEALATGEAGTVYLCHPFLVHAAQPHRGHAPRFLAQPPLLPKGPFDPAQPPSPVQIAIRKACGLPR
ncbi:phytanoyl-CoA dioxygenase family protein [Ancylobacter oerskovii]|uniref:Phytanoyl-CoA dioxygenase family protein n=1 Tax=Ancylobacter oerskovii TaxID=459519 RepID=A0ABW4Z3K3_9HYPH|nr:phytanoyl-CoA dioxygenase family protein [Ancylobacter oerskovii]MBS7545952.1 phytanoyl-CoA dioxygenase family protein [Ancylobacter oerskovii]